MAGALKPSVVQFQASDEAPFDVHLRVRPGVQEEGLRLALQEHS